MLTKYKIVQCKQDMDTFMLEALPTSQTRPEQSQHTAADSQSPANRNLKQLKNTQ